MLHPLGVFLADTLFTFRDAPETARHARIRVHDQ
jgi:hypothetical protein